MQEREGERHAEIMSINCIYFKNSQSLSEWNSTGIKFLSYLRDEVSNN